MKVALSSASVPLEIEVGGKVINCKIDMSDSNVYWVAQEVEATKTVVDAINKAVEERGTETADDRRMVVNCVVPVIKRSIGENAYAKVVDALCEGGDLTESMTMLVKLWEVIVQQTLTKVDEERREKIAHYLSDTDAAQQPN